MESLDGWSWNPWKGDRELESWQGALNGGGIVAARGIASQAFRATDGSKILSCASPCNTAGDHQPCTTPAQGFRSESSIPFGPSRITQIPQAFSGVTEVNLLRQLIPWEYFGVKDCAIFLIGTRQGGVVFLGILNIESPELIWCNWRWNDYTN